MRLLAAFNILLGVLFISFLAYLFLKEGQPRRLYDARRSEMLVDARVLQLVDEVARVELFYERGAIGPEVLDYRKGQPVMTVSEPAEVAQLLRELEKGGRELSTAPMKARGVLALVFFFKSEKEGEKEGEGARPALLHAMLGGRNACAVMPLQGTGDLLWVRAYSLFAFLKEKGLEQALVPRAAVNP